MDMEQNAAQQQAPTQQTAEKFCKHCGGKIPADAVVCTLCGRQVEQIAQSGVPNIVINNANQKQMGGAVFMPVFGRFRSA